MTRISLGRFFFWEIIEEIGQDLFRPLCIHAPPPHQEQVVTFLHWNHPEVVKGGIMITWMDKLC